MRDLDKHPLWETGERNHSEQLQNEWWKERSQLLQNLHSAKTESEKEAIHLKLQDLDKAYLIKMKQTDYSLY